MPKPSGPKDIRKMVYEAARAMALAGNGVSTPRVVKLYIDDARKVLLGVAKAAKRQGWTAEDLVLALDPPKPKRNPWEQHQSQPPFSREPDASGHPHPARAVQHFGMRRRLMRLARPPMAAR